VLLAQNPEMINSEDDIDIVQPPITQSAAHPLPFISGSHRPFTIQSMLNPLSPEQDGRDFGSLDMSDQATGTSANLGDLGDPVSRHLVSLEMAHHLYALYVFIHSFIVSVFECN
jgi:hypothetical protein